MRILAMGIASAATFAAAPCAFAAQDTTGEIRTFDARSHLLVLDNGVAYALPPAFKDPGVKVGQWVRLSWAVENGVVVAKRVILMSP